MAPPLKRMRRGSAMNDSRLSRAYLHHLERCGELLAPRLATLHNLRFYMRLLRQLGDAIERGQLAATAAALTRRWQENDLDGSASEADKAGIGDE